MFIQKWNEFVLESNTYDLLLEGNLVISDKLKELLSNVADQCPKDGVGPKIVQYLSTKPEVVDANLKQNYVDIAKPKEGEPKDSKSDVVSFIAQTKVNQLLEKDPSLKEADPFTLKGRTEVKVGRFLKAICALADIKSTDREIEQIVNLFKSSTEVPGQAMGLVEGKEIKYWYDGKNYLTDTGELGGSCMRYEKCQDYLNIYSKNPDKVKLLILTQEVDGKKKLIGRALVWILDESPCEAKIFMDRVYCHQQSDAFKFYSYAKKAGWLMKKDNNSVLESSIKFVYNGKQIKGKVSVKLTAGPKSRTKDAPAKTSWKYPFMDTICFLNPEKNEISNIGYINGWVMENTGGNINKCDNCKGTGIDSCDYCDGEGTIYCRNCEDGRVVCDDCDGDGEILSRCEECKGEGVIKKGKKESTCKKCDGDGEVTKQCERCDGKGSFKCDECNGTGRIDCDECDGGKSGGKCSECVGLLENN